MGVGASMSISIIVEGRLWGLFACHHYAARCASFERRSVSELFAQMFSMRLGCRERQETVEFERRARDISDQLLGAVASDARRLLKDPDWLGDILTNAIPADGVGVWISGAIYAFSGTTPPTEAFPQDHPRAERHRGGQGVRDRRDRLDRAGAEEFASAAAGHAGHPDLARAARLCRRCFGSELIRSVRWAGDPHKPSRIRPERPAAYAARELRRVEGTGRRPVAALHRRRNYASPRRCARTLIEVVCARRRGVG